MLTRMASVSLGAGIFLRENGVQLENPYSFPESIPRVEMLTHTSRAERGAAWRQ